MIYFLPNYFEIYMLIIRNSIYCSKICLLPNTFLKILCRYSKMWTRKRPQKLSLQRVCFLCAERSRKRSKGWFTLGKFTYNLFSASKFTTTFLLALFLINLLKQFNKMKHIVCYKIATGKLTNKKCYSTNSSSHILNHFRNFFMGYSFQTGAFWEIWICI